MRMGLTWDVWDAPGDGMGFLSEGASAAVLFC